jgi:tetratricopeptide (TPR) repeat protein
MTLVSILLAVAAASAEPSSRPALLAQAGAPSSAQPLPDSAIGTGGIEHKPLERSARGQPVFVRARVKNASRLFTPLVFARPAGSETYHAYSMVERGQGTYQVRLPASILDEGSFEYFIEARHDEGGATRSGAPRSPFICSAYDPPARPVQTTIRTDDPNATIKVDDNEVGKAPVTVPLGPGPHVIQAATPDGRSTEKQVDVKRARKLEVTVSLPARAGSPATLEVSSDPSRAQVLLDGAVVGVTPYAGELTAGPHTVAVVLQGRLHQERQIVARSGRDIQIAFALNNLPKDPALTVDSDPVGALISIDGKDRGRTPFLAPMPAGKHELVLRMPGRREVGTEFAMPKDKDLSLRLELPIAAGAAPRLTVTSAPDGADVVIDGKEIGLTPWNGELRLGDHQIKVRLAGYIASEREVKIQAGRDADLSFALERVPGPGKLRVETEPPDAEIRIDGKVAVTAPFGGDLPAGDHSVEVSSLGYRTVGQQITLEAGQQASLRIALSAASKDGAPSIIGVNSSPEKALLYIDGRLIGPTPRKAPAAPGPHELKLVLEGYKTWVAPTRLPDKPGFELRVAIALKPLREAESHEAPAALELARAQYKRAETCYSLGDFACAQAGYQAAYEYTRRPEMLFNIAQARRRMGNFKEALDAYQSFLRETGQPHPKVRQQTEKYIAFCQLMTQPGQKGQAAAAQQPKDSASPMALPLPGTPGAPALAVALPTVPEEDVAPPVIKHQPVRKAPRATPLRISAHIVDERSDVGNAQVCWRNLYRHGDYECAPLKPAGNDEFAAVVPPPAVADGFAYYIEAYDSIGNGPARSGTPDLPHSVALDEPQAAPREVAAAKPEQPKAVPASLQQSPAVAQQAPVAEPIEGPSSWMLTVRAGADRSEEQYTDPRSIGRVGAELGRRFGGASLLSLQLEARFSKQPYRLNQPGIGGTAPALDRSEQRYDAYLSYGYDVGPLLLKSGRLTAMPMLVFGYTRLQNEAFPSDFLGLGAMARLRFALSPRIALAGGVGWTHNLLADNSLSAVGGPRDEVAFRAGVELPFAGGYAISAEYRGEVLTLRNDQRIANGASIGVAASF